MGMLPSGKERVGEHEGGEGYLRVVSVGVGATGEAPAAGAMSGGARRGVPARRRGRSAAGRCGPATSAVARSRSARRRCAGACGGGPRRAAGSRRRHGSGTGTETT